MRCSTRAQRILVLVSFANESDNEGQKSVHFLARRAIGKLPVLVAADKTYSESEAVVSCCAN